MERGAYRSVPGGEVELTEHASSYRKEYRDGSDDDGDGDNEEAREPQYISHGQDVTRHQESKYCISRGCLGIILLSAALAATAVLHLRGQQEELPSDTTPPLSPAFFARYNASSVKVDPENILLPTSYIHPDQPKEYPGAVLPELLESCPNLTFYEDLYQKVAQRQIHFCDGGRENLYQKLDDCDCQNPAISRKRTGKYALDWERTFQRNHKMLQAHAQDERLDVILLGDSITEHWLGTDFGRVFMAGDYSECRGAYENLFRNKNPVSIQGLAMGIGGDRITHLLYRVQHGEVTTAKADVIWVNIGTNDLGGDTCNIGTVVGGNIAVVEEILRQVPSSKVVLNSLLPRSGHSADDTYLPKDRTWAQILRINQHLQCYALQRAPGLVDFFDATELFLTKNDSNYRNASLYHDPVHPLAEGYRIWGDAIIKRLVEMRSNPIPKGLPNLSCPSQFNYFDSVLLAVAKDPAERCQEAPCGCLDPQIPSNKTIMPNLWETALERNTELAIRHADDPNIDLLLIGDSITELWLGTAVGLPRERSAAMPSIFNETFSDLSTLIMGIAGDKSRNLLYRIKHGELPSFLNVTVVWLLIGTNDLNDGCNADAIVAGNIAVVSEVLRRQPEATVIINSILPRADRGEDVILLVNAMLRCYVKSVGENILFFDADQLFIDDEGIMKKHLFMDGVHPTEEGYRLWGQSIHNHTTKLLSLNRQR